MGAILREAVQASNCFKVIAVADDAVNKDLDKVFGEQQSSSQVKPGSDFQDGQSNAADYVIYPTVIFSEQETGSSGMLGIGAAMIGSKIPVIGGGGAKTNIKSSEMALELWSVRTRTRLAGGNGSANVKDFSFTVAGVPGVPAGGAFTQASKSPAGKATLEAMIKAYNEMVIGLQNYQEQQAENGGTPGVQLTAHLSTGRRLSLRQPIIGVGRRKRGREMPPERSATNGPARAPASSGVRGPAT